MKILSDCDSLEATFTIEKIKAAIWDCGNEKSLGPDGFTFSFIKNQWESVWGGYRCGGQIL